MSVILIEAHKKILRKVKRRAFIIHGLGLMLTAIVFLFPVLSRVEVNLVRETYGVVRRHLVEVESRYKLLEILRNKPLTVGQALQVADVVIEESRANKIPLPIVLGVIETESSFKTSSISSEGASGLMQVMPAVWSEYVKTNQLRGYSSRHDPALNVRVGVRYLGDVFKQYGDWEKALRVYGGFINKSEKGYVKLVLNRASRYKKMIEGVDGFYSTLED